MERKIGVREDQYYLLRLYVSETICLKCLDDAAITNSLFSYTFNRSKVSRVIF